MTQATAGRLAFGAESTASEANCTSIEAQAASLPLRPGGPSTAVLTYARSGTTEGLPIIRATVGQEACIALRNALAEPTSLQICGLRGFGSLDPKDRSAGIEVPPGRTGRLSLKAAESGFGWLRPRLGTSDQSGRGMAAVLIVDPPNGPAIDGELVLILQDWTLDAQNALAAKGGQPASNSTLVVTANQQAMPADHAFRPGARLRLRLLNGSTDRTMVVACEDAKPMIVAIDGQPSELFAPIRGTVPIGPGGRFEYLLDLPRDAGQSVRLTLRGTEMVDGKPEPDRLIATIKTDGPVMEAKPPIAALPPNPSLPTRIALESAKRAELTIDSAGGTWRVNGVAGVELPPRPVLRVKHGSPVALGFTNASKDLVPLSLNGQALRLLHPKDDGWEPYWRDTVMLPPGSRNHVAFVADQPGRWPIQSGFDAQAAAGLRCWFEVVPA